MCAGPEQVVRVLRVADAADDVPAHAGPVLGDPALQQRLPARFDMESYADLIRRD